MRARAVGDGSYGVLCQLSYATDYTHINMCVCVCVRVRVLVGVRVGGVGGSYGTSYANYRQLSYDTDYVCACIGMRCV